MTNTPREVDLILASRGLSLSEQRCLRLLSDTGEVIFRTAASGSSGQPSYGNLVGFLRYLVGKLREHNLGGVAGSYADAIQRCTTEQDFGGCGFNEGDELSPENESEIVFFCSAYLEAMKSAARAKLVASVQTTRPKGRRGMTMAEKIFAMHDISRRGFVAPGDIIQVDIDWIIASELSWKVIKPSYQINAIHSLSIKLIQKHTANRAWKGFTTVWENQAYFAMTDSGWLEIIASSLDCMMYPMLEL